jgi:hypothetical protein
MTVDSNGLIFVDQNSSLAWWISRMVAVSIGCRVKRTEKNHLVTSARHPGILKMSWNYT